MSRETAFSELFDESHGFKITLTGCETRIECTEYVGECAMYFVFEKHPVCKVEIARKKPVIESMQKVINRLKNDGYEFDRCLIVTSIRNCVHIANYLDGDKHFDIV